MRDSMNVVVVDGACGLGGGPLQALAQPPAHLGGEVWPAGVAVLARDHELRVALRQGRVEVRQVHARPCEGLGLAGGDAARELLGLLAEGLEGRTNRLFPLTPG